MRNVWSSLEGYVVDNTLSALATHVEVLSGTSPFFLEVVSSASVACVSHCAPGVCVDKASL